MRGGYRFLLLGAVLSSLPASLGCAPQTLSAGPTVPTLVQVDGGARRVIELTDLDRVHGVAKGRRQTLVATDGGVLVYPLGAGPTPERLVEGLGGNAVTAVDWLDEATALVAAGSEVYRVQVGRDGSQVLESAGPPAVGRVRDLLVTDDARWACGALGLARATDGGWEHVGEPMSCVGLETAPGGAMWVATEGGALYIESDVIHEHVAGPALVAPYVRDIVSLDEKEALALLLGPKDGALLAHFDGDRWYGYTIAEFDAPIVGLEKRGDEVLMVTKEHVFVIDRGPEVEGVPLTMLERGPRHGVRVYRPRVRPADELPAAPAEDEVNERVEPPEALRDVPVDHVEPEASRFVVRPDDHLVDAAYGAWVDGGVLFLADENRGVLEAGGDEQRWLRSHNLVAERDLQIASDADGNTWLVTDQGDLGRSSARGMARVAPPVGARPQAIATGPDGAYVVSLVEGEAGTVRIDRADPEGFVPNGQHRLELGTELVGVVVSAVDRAGNFWLVPRVRRDDGEGTRVRGLVLVPSDGGPLVYHHRGADPEQDGPGALAIPDEVSALDTSDESYVWAASLGGAVRIGNEQAVTYGEARGVRGELVSDLAVAGDRVWIAAAEGLGYYEGGEMDFTLPGLGGKAKPSALAARSSDEVWGAGPNGAIHRANGQWTRLTKADGLPAESLLDVEIDADGRVWFLSDEAVIVFAE